jgi:hypothetical protein
VTLAARLAASRWLLGLLAVLASCARNVAVGHEDALAAAGAETGASGEPGTGGVAGNATGGSAASGGASGGGEAGGAEAGGSDAGNPLWSADHEVASFDEWLGDGEGIRYEQRTGQLALTSERAHSGSRSFTASLTTDDGELHQAMMGRNIRLREGRYGAWFLLPESPRADYWVIMKLSNGSFTDRFDLDIEAREGAAAHLRLFEHPNTWITEPASVAFPVGRWVHVEMLYRSTPSADGRILVLQDGQQVLDSGPRFTANDDRVTFFCGSASREVTPSPFRLFIDDASIHASALP